MVRFAAHKLSMISFLLAVFFACTHLAHANELATETRDTRDKTVALADLPLQAQRAYALIFRGGPFPYDKDGSVFGNRERRLPVRARGYYREYTVKTPGAKNRGGRRIACGGPPRNPAICYYSNDHYASFRKIGS